MAKLAFVAAMPCPHCGQELKPLLAANKLDVNGYSHAVTDCYLSGVFIGAQRIPAFNRRAGPE